MILGCKNGGDLLTIYDIADAVSYGQKHFYRFSLSTPLKTTLVSLLLLHVFILKFRFQCLPKTLKTIRISVGCLYKF